MKTKSFYLPDFSPKCEACRLLRKTGVSRIIMYVHDYAVQVKTNTLWEKNWGCG